jgi:hypothetical protein
MCFVFHGFGQGLKAMSKTARRCRDASNAATAAGDPAMAFHPFGCERAIHGARSFFGGFLPPHEQAARYASALNRAGQTRADVNGGY